MHPFPPDTAALSAEPQCRRPLISPPLRLSLVCAFLRVCSAVQGALAALAGDCCRVGVGVVAMAVYRGGYRKTVWL